VIVVIVIALMTVGYSFVTAGFSYELQYKLKMPELNTEVKAAVDSAVVAERIQSGIISPKNLMDFTNEFVADRLKYEYSVSVKEPNLAWRVRKVNCTGYSALQVAVLNYFFREYKGLIPNELHAEWHSSKVFLFGFWLGNISPKIGYHAYPVVFDTQDVKYFPDACFKDITLGLDGYIVRKEN